MYISGGLFSCCFFKREINVISGEINKVKQYKRMYHHIYLYVKNIFYCELLILKKLFQTVQRQHEEEKPGRVKLKGTTQAIELFSRAEVET